MAVPDSWDFCPQNWVHLRGICPGKWVHLCGIGSRLSGSRFVGFFIENWGHLGGTEQQSLALPHLTVCTPRKSLEVVLAKHLAMCVNDALQTKDRKVANEKMAELLTYPLLT